MREKNDISKQVCKNCNIEELDCFHHFNQNINFKALPPRETEYFRNINAQVLATVDTSLDWIQTQLATANDWPHPAIFINKQQCCKAIFLVFLPFGLFIRFMALKVEWSKAPSQSQLSAAACLSVSYSPSYQSLKLSSFFAKND